MEPKVHVLALDQLERFTSKSDTPFREIDREYFLYSSLSLEASYAEQFPPKTLEEFSQDLEVMEKEVQRTFLNQLRTSFEECFGGLTILPMASVS